MHLLNLKMVWSETAHNISKTVVQHTQLKSCSGSQVMFKCVSNLFNFPPCNKHIIIMSNSCICYSILPNISRSSICFYLALCAVFLNSL